MLIALMLAPILLQLIDEYEGEVLLAKKKAGLVVQNPCHFLSISCKNITLYHGID